MIAPRRIEATLDAFELELEKIALIAEPESIVHLFHRNQALRTAASPDLLQKMRPGTGSLFQAVGEKAKLMMGGMRAKGEANKALGGMAQNALSHTAETVHQDNAALEQLGKVREAERAIHGPGLTGKGPVRSSWFPGSGGGSGTHGSSAKQVAFGVGAGTAGVLAAQHYWKKRQEGAGYPPAY